MDYKDLLDFKNQVLVDEVYQYAKTREENSDLDKAYEEVSNRNKSNVKDAKVKVEQLFNQAIMIAGMIFMFIFTIFYTVCISLIFSLVIMAFQEAMGVFPDFYQWLVGFGQSLFSSTIDGSGVFNDPEVANSLLQLYYILGLGSILFVLFTGLYLRSVFKKDKKKKEDESIEKEISLKQSYANLQVDPDDRFVYIRNRFKQKMIRKNRVFFQRYIISYYNIFCNHHEIEGTYQSLTTKQKVTLVFRSCINVCKNVLGSWSKPLFLAIVLMIIYARTFTMSASDVHNIVDNATMMFGGAPENFIATSLTLELALSSIPLGGLLWSLIEFCYSIIHPFVASFIDPYPLEMAKFMGFLIFIIIAWFSYSVIRYKIPESIRQYHRRKQYYLKINNQDYDEKQSFSKSYNYTIEFTAFIFIVLIIVAFLYIV